MFLAIRHNFDAYVQRLPKNIPSAAVYSALYSFVASALLAGSVQVGTFGAGLAATVTIINGLMMPFFRQTLADHNGNLKWYHQAITQVINLSIAQVLINSFTAYRVNLMAGAAFTVTLNLILNGFQSRSTDVAPSYILASN